MNIPDTIYEIYDRAANALDDSCPGCCSLEETLVSFRAELRALLDSSDESLSFGEAQNLDVQYIGVLGKYWVEAFGNPDVGEEVTVTYHEKPSTLRVLEKGLLTMRMEKI